MNAKQDKQGDTPVVGGNCRGGKRNRSRGSASEGTKHTLEAHELAAFGAQDMVLPGCRLGCGGLVDRFSEWFSELQ